jgi:predicted oxidoreductase
MFYFPPKTTDHEKELIFRNLRSQEVIMPENSLEPEIQDVVKGLLVHSPDNRMSLDEVAEKVEQLIQFSTIKPTEKYGMIYVCCFKCLYII